MSASEAIVGERWRLPGLLYAEDLVLRGESGEALIVIIGLVLKCAKEMV